MTARFSGYEPHTCPDWAPCPVCQSVPVGMLGRKSFPDPEYVLALMIEDGLIDVSLVPVVRDTDPESGRERVAA